MKNKFKILIFILLWFIYFFKNTYSNEPFIFDVTEIEILENGNQIYGHKGGTATLEDGSTFIAENFYYNKVTNILEATGNVKFLDIVNNSTITSEKAIYLKNDEKIFTAGNSKAVNKNNTITASSLEYDKIKNIFKAKKNAVINDLEKDSIIYADEITYLKNEEKVFTVGDTKALVQKKYKFNSNNVFYFRNTEEIYSQKYSTVEDDNGNIYKLENFLYNLNKELLKGTNVEVLAKVDKNKIDKYYFSEGFFNFKDKSHIAKETKIKIHKEVFGDNNNDPRIYGSSSSSNEREIIVHNGLFTSCKLNDDCPPWSIKAEKITNDKIKKDMIYKNAILKIYNVPVLYFPKFFHPDPSVKRRSGFLQPQFNNSETLGSSLYIPYFKTLGHDKDITFKPTLFEKIKKFEKEKYILQSEFRKKSKNSSLIADLAFLRDYKSITDSKVKYKNVNHLFLKYKNDFKNPNFLQSQLEVQVEKVTNDTYLKVFQNNLFETPAMPDSQSTMNSRLKLYFKQESLDLTTGIEVYENLGEKNSDRYQYTFPYYDLSKNISNLIDEKVENGSLYFYSSGTNKLSDTNNLRTTINNDINYLSDNYISKLGFKSNFNLYFKNLNSIGKNDPIYNSNPQIDGISILKIDTAYPLIKSQKKNSMIRETLTPKISFRMNPGNNMNDYSNSSSIISADSAFDINRLGITDDFEAGRSLTFGLDYKFDQLEANESEDTKDKYLTFKLATILRDKNEADIPKSSTINRKNSNLFGSIDYQLLSGARPPLLL